LHIGLFLIAHFHNTIIGGAVFGYLAGFTFWFPKAFGFKLNEKLGKAAFWFWQTGFYFAFMPLYVLGFLGMTRRLNHTNNPEWDPWLYVALFGALLVACGIACQLLQIAVSVLDRKNLADKTGDPWNGHTLEWSTSSPPPFYNFAKVPHVHDIDAFTDMKEKGTAYAVPRQYAPIHMPKNTSAGVFIGAFATVLGFAMIWHIWWMAIAGLAGIVASMLARAYDNDIDYYVQPDEIEHIERLRFEKLGIDADFYTEREPAVAGKSVEQV